MKLKLLLLFLSANFFSNYSYAQNTSKDTWNRILQTADVQWQTIYEKCPNFPQGYMEDKEFSEAISKWSKNYSEEVKAFYSIDKIKKANPSPYYLGLPLEEKTNYSNSFIQWVKESKITDRRLMELAPHFPDMNLPKEEFDYGVKKWQNLYGHEYEKLINAEELIALNPFYTKYLNVSQIPHFIGPLESVEKPIKKDGEDEIAYELKTMNWYFVFEPQSFRKIYGFTPEFPDFFDVAKYKQAIITKIKETENQRKLGNVETN